MRGGGRRWELRPAWPKIPDGIPWARGPLRGRTSDSPGGTPLRGVKKVGGGRGGMGWVRGEGGGGVGSYTQKAVHTQGGAYTRRNTQKAVCSHRRSLVI